MGLRTFSFFLVSFICASHSFATAEEPIKVGWIGPLTGPASILGVDTVPAFELGITDEGLQSKIQLVVEDDQYEAAKSISAYRNLVHAKGVKVIIVLTYGGIFALAEQAKKDGVLLIDTLDCDDAIAKLPSNVICLAKTTENLGEVIAAGAVEKKQYPAGILYFNSDPFMGTLAQASKAYIEANGGLVGFENGYIGGTTDFRSILLNARSKALRSLFFYGYDEMGLAMKQARDMGLKMQFYAVNTITSPAFQKAAGAAAENATVGTFKPPHTAEYESFIEQFTKRVGRAPAFEVSTLPTYDFARLLSQYVKRTNSLSSKEFETYLYSVSRYSGVSGPITIDSDGVTRSLKNGRYTFRQGKLIPQD